MFKSRAVAGNGNGLEAILVTELRRFREWLMFLRLLERVLNELFERNRVAAARQIAREKEHLAGETRHALHPFVQRGAQRLAELGVVVILVEQLLVRRERHERVADFVREPF